MTEHGDREQEISKRLAQAYERMLERAGQGVRGAAADAGSVLQRAVQAAKDKAVELGELTREEAEKTGDALLRDLHDAASFLAFRGRDLADWLRLDLLGVERQALDTFSRMAEYAKADLKHLAKSGLAFGEWHTGEVTGLGTLACKQCGKTLHFHQAVRIPPCPACHGTVFVRPGG